MMNINDVEVKSRQNWAFSSECLMSQSYISIITILSFILIMAMKVMNYPTIEKLIYYYAFY